MARVHWILVTGLLFGALLFGCSSGGKTRFIPAIGPEEGAETVRTRRDAPDCVMDLRNRVFHRESCPRVEELPEKDRVRCDSVYTALNRGYAPCEECRPLPGVR